MSVRNFNIAIAGATGAVGQEIVAVLERRGFPVGECRLLASSRSAGKTMRFRDQEVTVQELSASAFKDIDIAFFSAGATRSREFAPAALESGALVVDNSSAFRMDPEVPLIIPEVNAEQMGDSMLIANPNCCAAILAVAIWPLHQKATLKRVVVSTYQSASGAGAQAMEELKDQVKAFAAGEEPKTEIFPYPIAFNVFSHNSAVAENGFNDEENKLVQEVQKIFSTPELEIVPTCIRVPVLRAHSEAVLMDFAETLSASEAREILASAPGVTLVDDVEGGHFPMPIEAAGELDVHVGRLRDAGSSGRSVALFISGDQLLKGAAWNAVQIAETWIRKA
ncbi:MAG: aspartate-semialdehyde dehydrogenase [Verrucomicrobiota bacterium]